MRSLSFKSKILGLNTVLLVGSLGALGAYFAQTGYKNELKSAESMVVSDSDIVYKSMRALFNTKEKLAESKVAVLSDNPDDAATLIENPVIINEFMVSGAYLADKEVFIENDPSVEVPDSYDPTTRPWYKNAIRKSGVHASDVYYDEVNDVQTITLSSQFTSDGSVAFFDVNLNKISKTLQDTIAKGKTFDVMNEDGLIFLSSNPLHIGKTFNSFAPDFDLYSKQPSIVSLDGVTVMGVASKVKAMGKTLYVVTGVDVRSIEQDARDSMLTSIVAILLACFVGFAVNYFASRRLLKPIDELNEAVEKIAHGEGDLTQKIDHSRFDPEFETLAENVNEFIESTRKNMSLCIENAGAINSITQNLNSGGDKTSDLMRRQGEEVDSLVNSMEEMLIATKGIAQSAESAAVSANETDLSAEEGIRIVAESQKAMRDLSEIISEASRNVSTLSQTAVKIENVTGAISGVAEQTNLLALNAAIEAARAGEHGRGFAVVADEVRGLAMRTQQSTNEIGQIVQEIQCSIESVVNSMQESVLRSDDATQRTTEVEQALTSIKDFANAISQMNEQIAAASEEQGCVAQVLEQGTQSLKVVSDSVTEIVDQTSKDLMEQGSIIGEQQEVLKKFTV